VTGRWSRTAAALTVAAVASTGGLGCSDDDSADSADAAGSAGASTTTTEAGSEAGSDAERLTGSYVGTVEGSDAYVAIVVADDGGAVAFVTDGGESVDFLDGFVDGEGAVLGNDGGAELKVNFTEGTTTDEPSRPVVLSGTFVRPDSDPLRYTAGATEAPAGLYRAVQSFADGEYQGSWVVLPDGSQRGAVRRYETPLPPGSVDTVLDLAEPDSLAVEVPGGVLHPVYVDPARL
jgi:hypothetical protein